MGLAVWLSRIWWARRPGLGARCLQPLAGVFQGLVGIDRWRARQQEKDRPPLRAPVVVVGNLIVGGAGKTPTVLALIDGLRTRGWHPGVISRGYGRQGHEVLAVSTQSDVAECGDEPLLIHLRSGVPVVVGADRLQAARHLLDKHPEVDLLISDDGLQHWRLPRQAQVLVFDARGLGNGLTLPAGPLRQAFTPVPPARSLVLYNAEQPSTPWPGVCASRGLGQVLSLQAWWAGRAETDPGLRQRLIDDSQRRPMLAAAGVGDPERFFRMLEAQGFRIERLPLADHARLDPLPWPAETSDVLLTEKDAVKLHPERLGATRAWVLRLDFSIPTDFIDALDALVRPTPLPAPRHEP